MEEKNTEHPGVNITRFIDALIRKVWLIGIVGAGSAVLAFIWTFFYVTPMYESSAMFYVDNCSPSAVHTSASVSSGDITASRSLVKSCITILKTGETLDAVINCADVDITHTRMKEMITAEAVDNTEFFRVTVTGPDPMEAERIAEAIAHVLPGRISCVMDGTSAKIVDSPQIPTAASSPNYRETVAAGFLAGLLIAAGCVTLQAWADLMIRREEQIAACCGYPVLAYIPEVKDIGKKKCSPGKKGASSKWEEPSYGISSEAEESFRRLSTKLQYIFADQKECTVLGISSAIAAEGKSVTALNLAHSMAQKGKRVLVIDCDVRQLSRTSVLPFAGKPGLSDYLMKCVSDNHLIRQCKTSSNDRAFYVMPCGKTPLKPVELLGSERMEKLLGQLRELYDMIILDLPSVGDVGDALAMSGFLDGLVLVIRRNHCNRIALQMTASQLEFVNTKMVGTVFNCACSKMGQFGHWLGRRRAGTKNWIFDVITQISMR